MKKMRKVIILLLSLIICPLLFGCNSIDVNKQPDLLQVRNIVNLATLECYYHNVAKGIKDKGTGVIALGEKDRKFWIEYTGIVRFGIDMSLVDMDIKDNDITITMPQAKVLGVTLDDKSWNPDSIISSEDGVNPNKIKSEDITKAINDAQKTMEETAVSNTTLLNNAQMRAQTLIENYIKKFGEIVGKEYTITWKYISKTSE